MRHRNNSSNSFGAQSGDRLIKLAKKVAPSSRLLLALVFLAAVSAFLVVSSKSSTKTYAAPFPSCDTNGFLYQYPSGPTQVHSIDMVTAQDTVVPPNITGRQINAIGYNVRDNFIYGWDDDAAGKTFVRVHGDHTVDPLTISGYTGATTGIIIGDVDNNGHYWFITGATWHQVDLATLTQIDSGTVTGIPAGYGGGADWAYVPGTDSLYRMMNNGGTDMRLISFSRTTKTWTDHTPVTPIAGITIPSDFNMGAFYADPNGYLYGSSNTPSGKLWRLNINSTPYTAEHIGTGTPSSSNDGARCASAPIPIDFGDAPSSFGTLLTDGGPRHGIIGYNFSTKTAPLMLGKKVDIENNGFPGSQATGDDANDIDDERGVTHIVATPGTPTALSIPVMVSNNNSQAATLAGWVDLDSDGVFETGERVTLTIPANSAGTHKLNFPTTTFTSNSFARFRVFLAGDTSDAAVNLLPTGPAAGGEVEDVLVQVGTYNVSKAANPAEGSSVSSGQNVTYTLTISNTGSTALTNLKIDDNLADVLDDATLVGSPTVSPSSAGTASVSDNVLEFTGDIGTGQTITVTYTVQIKAGGALGNSTLHNTVLAAHSTNCHPDANGGSATASHADCNTTHPVLGLASTGSSLILPLALAGGLIGAAGLALYLGRRHVTSSKTSQQ